MKKSISWLLAVLMLLSLAAGAFADEGGSNDLLVPPVMPLSEPEPTVTFNATAGGSVTRGSADSAGNVQATAVASSGYRFTGWTCNGALVSSNETDYFTPFAGGRLVTANFEAVPSSYQILLSADPSAGGTVTGGGVYPVGDYPVSAVASTGYTFTGWYENGSCISTSANELITANRDRTLVAKFAQQQAPGHVLTLSVDPASAGSVSGAGTFTPNIDTPVSAVAYTGYTFDGWYENGTRISTLPSELITMYASRSITAKFVAESPAQVVITAVPNSASYGSVAGAGSFAPGASVSLTASPAAGYLFSCWTENGAVVSSANPYAFQAANNRSLIANFIPGTTTFSVTYHSGAYATTPNQTAAYTYNNGTNVPVLLNQYLRIGYYQDGWSLTDGGANNDYPFGSVIANLSGNLTLYPHWVANAAVSYTLTITYNSQYGSVYYGNTYMANGSTLRIAQGESKTLSFIPQQKYYVWNVNFAGVNKGSWSSYTVSYDAMRGANRTMNVTFASIYASPKTGDTSNIALWAALAVCAAGGMGVLLFVNRKSSNKAGKKSRHEK